MWTAAPPVRVEGLPGRQDDQGVALLVGGHPSLELILVPRRSGRRSWRAPDRAAATALPLRNIVRRRSAE
jgi:hypothetical protein